MKYKYLTIIALLISCCSFSQSKQTVYISDWIVKPTEEVMQKPLIFIDFWATWCGPCINSMSYTELLADKYQNDILFMYISNEHADKVSSFMNKKNKTFYSAVDNTNQNIENFNVKSLPHSVLMTNEGEVVWTGKPTDINEHILEKYIRRGSKQKSNSWYHFSAVNSIEENWHHFGNDTLSINYLHSETVSNDFKVQEHEFMLSGDLKYLTSKIYDVPLTHVFVEGNDSYIFTSQYSKTQSFDLIKRFLELNYTFKDSVKLTEVYELDEGNPESFKNSNTEDFELGDNICLCDETSIQLDNATISQMSQRVSEETDFKFIYNGVNDQIYDWFIIKSDNDYLMKELKTLGFKLNLKTIDQHYIYVK